MSWIFFFCCFFFSVVFFCIKFSHCMLLLCGSCRLDRTAQLSTAHKCTSKELIDRSQRIHLMSAQCVCWPFPFHIHFVHVRRHSPSDLTILFFVRQYTNVFLATATTAISLCKNILNGSSTLTRNWFWYRTIILGRLAVGPPPQLCSRVCCSLSCMHIISSSSWMVVEGGGEKKVLHHSFFSHPKYSLLSANWISD